MPRPTILTSSLINKLTAAIRKSPRSLIKSITEDVGISYEAYNVWVNNAKENKKKIAEGKIKIGDLTAKQKNEIKLFDSIKNVRFETENSYLERIYLSAVEKNDIRGFQYLLKIINPDYCDIDKEDSKDISLDISNDVIVSTIGPGGDETNRLISEFVNGSVMNPDEKEEHNEDPEGEGE